mmetsp:Transcript_45504/g.99099  ORF Transcript_45504/g.99099 Transcript_45504/m.99099 type:complete len:138 (-) Transcript_45504:28-441(-)
MAYMASQFSAHIGRLWSAKESAATVDSGLRVNTTQKRCTSGTLLDVLCRLRHMQLPNAAKTDLLCSASVVKAMHCRRLNERRRLGALRLYAHAGRCASSFTVAFVVQRVDATLKRMLVGDVFEHCPAFRWGVRDASG